MCFFVFSLLCFIRKIEIFAVTHVFADIMILITMIVVIVFGIKNLDAKGESQLYTLSWFNTETYASGIGFAVYCYEGIGIIMPI